MSNATNYLEKKITDHILGKAAFTMPATAYLALFTADPGETGSLTAEISTSSSGYARQAITASMGAAGSTDGRSANTAVINFGPATSNWGTITHAAVCDAATAGNVLVVIPLDTPQVINSGGNLQFPVGELEVTTA